MSNNRSDAIVETSFHVRYAETDAMGIVHHAAYIVWFEEARSAFMRARGASYTEFEKHNLHLAVSAVQARYIAPARYDQQVTICCRVEQIQSRKVSFGYEVLDTSSRKQLATGCSEHICITSDGNIARIPRQWQALLHPAIAL